MPQKPANPARGGETGSGKCSLPGGVNTPINMQKSSCVQEVIAALKREFVSECLRIAAIKASHGSDNIEIGDDLNAERDIRIAIANMKEAANAFRELTAGGAL